MFRRRWSGLPDDPDFPADLEKLGYFVNDDDEIRSIVDPKFYFNYFLDKTMRINDRQRFAFNLAVTDIIHSRLTSLNLTKLPLPLHTAVTSPHTPIFISDNLKSAKRVVVIFGEPEQDLGVLAHRIIGGQGGIDEGSMVSIVKALQSQGGGGEDKAGEVGIVLANTGETWWWPEGKRALCYRQSMGVKMASSVHKGIWFDRELNGIPDNADAAAHVRCVFESVLGNDEFVAKAAVIQVLGCGDGGTCAKNYLDENWERWVGRIGCLAMVGDGMGVDGPGTSYGCPFLTTGEPGETALIQAKGRVLPWMEEAYKGGKSCVNPVIEIDD